MNENERIIDEKIRKLGTKIIAKAKEYSLIEKKLKEIFDNKKIVLKQIYKGTRDGDDAKSFHSKCDDLRGSLILIKVNDKLVFGGFTKEKWSGDCVFKLDDTSFLFSFFPPKIYEIKTTDIIYVLGSTISNNTLTLKKLAEESHPKSKVIMIENASFINKEDLKGVKKVAITSGASTSKETVLEVKEFLEKI